MGIKWSNKILKIDAGSFGTFMEFVEEKNRAFASKNKDILDKVLRN